MIYTDLLDLVPRSVGGSLGAMVAVSRECTMHIPEYLCLGYRCSCMYDLCSRILVPKPAAVLFSNSPRVTTRPPRLAESHLPQLLCELNSCCQHIICLTAPHTHTFILRCHDQVDVNSKAPPGFQEISVYNPVRTAWPTTTFKCTQVEHTFVTHDAHTCVYTGKRIQLHVHIHSNKAHAYPHEYIRVHTPKHACAQNSH